MMLEQIHIYMQNNEAGPLTIYRMQKLTQNGFMT